MKLPIKKEYFDKIKSGEKVEEFRDAHITFVCEETGETLRKNVCDILIVGREDIPQGTEDLFEDEDIILFSLT